MWQSVKENAKNCEKADQVLNVVLLNIKQFCINFGWLQNLSTYNCKKNKCDLWNTKVLASIWDVNSFLDGHCDHFDSDLHLLFQLDKI